MRIIFHGKKTILADLESVYEFGDSLQVKVLNFNCIYYELKGTSSWQDKPQKREEKPQKQIEVMPAVLAELQRRALKAEATLKQKEEENAALREELQQFETKWSDYEARMKSMEETWQKQMASLQVSMQVFGSFYLNVCMGSII